MPEQFLTIQDAIDSAEMGDTVIVYPGTYYEHITIKGGVSLVSYAGDDGDELVEGPGQKKVLRRTKRTIIDGSKLNPATYLVSFEKESNLPMKLDGFTIRNLPKRATERLFLVEVRGCSPQVTHNIVYNNHSRGKGGGILLTGLGPSMGPPLKTVAEPTVTHNVVYNNHGAGISNGPNSRARISYNESFGNRFTTAKRTEDLDAPGIGMREYARPIIEHNLCHHNGAGIGGINLISNPHPIIIRYNTLHYNRRGGIGLRAIDTQQNNITVAIEQNIICNNLRGGIYLKHISESLIKNNQIYRNIRAGISYFEGIRSIIQENEIFGNLKAGVRMEAEEATIENNNIYYNLLTGIEVVKLHKSHEGQYNRDNLESTE
ncbi:MAG: right-handed parallel beta-helix repeat-containing protein [bacterium]